MRFNGEIGIASTTEARASTLTMISQLGAALAATTEVSALIVTLRSQLKWLMPAQYVSLCLLDDDGGRYHVLSPARDGATYSADTGLVGWALRHRTMLDVPDLLDESRLPPGVGGIAWHQGQGALLVLPLEAEGHLLGALAVGSSRINAYQDLDRGIASLIVLQVAAAVRMALLVAELDSAATVISSMARAVEAKDPYTQGHADRVTAYAVTLAAAAGVPTHVRELVAQAGPLHDVGKIGVPDHVLAKTTALTDEEFALIKQHPVIGDEICRPLRSLRRLRPGIRHHHERYDGRGYPDGLAGEDIPLEARVLAIADTYDAMTSDRPYRTGMPVARALSIIAANEGPQWDPTLVRVFCALESLQDTGVRG